MTSHASRRGLLWPIGITAVLAAVVGVNIWIAVIASGDPSFAIEPDYYRKAIAWDSSMAQAERNNALGWSLLPTLSTFGDSGAALRVVVHDAAGAAVSGAIVEVSARYNARAGQVITAQLSGSNDGTYASTLPVRHPGVWELAFVVTRGADRFTQTTRIDAMRSGGP